MSERAGNWIRERRRSLGITRREDLAAKTGLGLSTILRAEQGVRTSRSSIISIANALGVTPPEPLADWLEGTITERKFLAEVHISGGRTYPVHQMTGGFNAASHRVVALPPKDFAVTLAGTPILGEVTAGGLVESIVFEGGDEPERVPIVYSGKDRVYALRIRGDSMSPEYRSGEVLIVQDIPIEHLQDGEDVVIQCDGARDGASTFKRCIFTGEQRIKLMPLNPTYATCECEMRDVVRVGRVLGIYRAIRKASMP